LLVSPALVAAQLTFAPTVGQSDPIQEILDRGRGLETDRRWSEALTYYEEALRQHPGEERIEQRFTASKLHYDLVRRYNDSSFNQSLVTLSETEALNLYSEVLLKLQSHYVDPPNWGSLVERGTQSLEIALRDPVFAQRHGRQLSNANLIRFSQDLRLQLQRRPVRDRHSARDAVSSAAQLARTTLGLPGAPVVMEFICGATNALDDYSAFLTADQLNEVYSQIDGNFVGLGIELKAENGTLLIVNVIPGSPAERGGLAARDMIVAVDNRSTESLSTDEAANLLQGPEGSKVRVTVARDGQQPRDVTLERRHVEIPSITDDAIIDPANGVAYLKLTCFQKTTARDLDAALWKLHRLGMRSLIIDLRKNPGGLLTSAVEIVDKFVDNGTIVSTRGRNPSEDFNYSAHRAGTWRVPLVVLIDGDSASASEIFAGAMRDHRRAVIVGTRSYGKGSVQGIFPLTLARSGLRLTTAKFYSPQGLPYTKVGVSPDVEVQRVARPVSEGLDLVARDDVDLALERAIQVAQGRVARK
jgi:carboxyl-terminal processing protease